MSFLSELPPAVARNIGAGTVLLRRGFRGHHPTRTVAGSERRMVEIVIALVLQRGRTYGAAELPFPALVNRRLFRGQVLV